MSTSRIKGWRSMIHQAPGIQVVPSGMIQRLGLPRDYSANTNMHDTLANSSIQPLQKGQGSSSDIPRLLSAGWHWLCQCPESRRTLHWQSQWHAPHQGHSARALTLSRPTDHAARGARRCSERGHRRALHALRHHVRLAIRPRQQLVRLLVVNELLGRRVEC
jgi:hypothetical protein